MHQYLFLQKIRIILPLVILNLHHFYEKTPVFPVVTVGLIIHVALKS